MLKTKIWINIKKDLNDESLKIYNSRKEFKYLPFKSLSPKNKKIKISCLSPKKEIDEDKNSKRKNKKKLKKIIIKKINLIKTPIKKKILNYDSYSKFDSTNQSYFPIIDSSFETINNNKTKSIFFPIKIIKTNSAEKNNSNISFEYDENSMFNRIILKKKKGSIHLRQNSFSNKKVNLALSDYYKRRKMKIKKKVEEAEKELDILNSKTYKKIDKSDKFNIYEENIYKIIKMKNIIKLKNENFLHEDLDKFKKNYFQNKYNFFKFMKNIRPNYIKTNFKPKTLLKYNSLVNEI